jgi:xeroderma pigmentosum group C-complementing protein
MNGNKLGKEYFDLVRSALKDETQKDTSSSSRPLKKRKTRQTPTCLPTSVNNISKGTIDYDKLVDITQNVTGEVDLGEAQRLNKLKTKRETQKHFTSPRKDEVIEILSSEEEQEKELSEDEYKPEDEFDDDDFEDVDVDNFQEFEDEDEGFTFRIDKDSSNSKNKKKAMISPELKEYRYTYYRTYIIVNLLLTGIKNKWCNNGELLKKLDPLLPSNIFNALHPPKDLKLPVKSTNKLIFGLKEAIVFWNKYFVIDEDRDIGLYMRDWNELEAKVIYPTSNKDTFTEQKFVECVLKKRYGSREVSILGFVSLLRSVGLNCRLVYNMQPPDITDIGRLPKSKVEQIEYTDFNDCNSINFPIFWCEVWDKYTKKWLTCDPVFFKTVERHVSNANTLSKLCPRNAKEEQRLITRYVVAYNKNLKIRDVTPRYTNRYFSKVYSKKFKNDKSLEKWYNDLLNTLSVKFNKENGMKNLKIDDYEDKFMEEKLSIESFPDSIKDFQNHPKFILSSKIPTTKVYLNPDAKPVGFFKNDKVYLRDDLQILKSKNKWLREGRSVIEGSRPKKIVKNYIMSKRGQSDAKDNAETELFTLDQTEIFKPSAPLPNGTIITNKFGNIEVYHPNMIPTGCVLIEHPLVIKAADYLKIKYAKAVVGWDFSGENKAKGKNSNAKATAKFGGIVCLQTYQEAVWSIIEELENINKEKKILDRQKQNMRKWVELFKRLKIKERLDGEINASGWLSQNTNQVDTMKEEDVTSEKEVEESDNSEEFEGGFEVSEEEKDEKDPSNASDMDFDDFMNEIGI